jgi:hypothetical protein
VSVPPAITATSGAVGRPRAPRGVEQVAHRREALAGGACRKRCAPEASYTADPVITSRLAVAVEVDHHAQGALPVDPAGVGACQRTAPVRPLTTRRRR